MSRALVLNATYEPLAVVPARRAVVLVLAGKATTLEEQAESWHSERVVLAVPSVVRLVRYVKVPYGRTVSLTRNAVFARDGHQCQYCSGPAESIDHVMPKSRGGLHVWENVVAACRRCNLRKAAELPEEAGFVLARKPVPPSRVGWVHARVGPKMDPLWHSYLLSASA